MNGVSLSNQVIHWNPKKFAVKQNFNKVIKENEKVFNFMTIMITKFCINKHVCH